MDILISKEFFRRRISGRRGDECEEYHILGFNAMCFGRGLSKWIFSEIYGVKSQKMTVLLLPVIWILKMKCWNIFEECGCETLSEHNSSEEYMPFGSRQ
jgi:hypothetical protein